jgi:hypothetical protein
VPILIWRRLRTPGASAAFGQLAAAIRSADASTRLGVARKQSAVTVLTCRRYPRLAWHSASLARLRAALRRPSPAGVFGGRMACSRRADRGAFRESARRRHVITVASRFGASSR